MNATSTPPKLRLRHPSAEDGAAMWALVKETGVLDLNSAYLYIMMGLYYSEACILAEDLSGPEPRLTGFVMGFIPPQKDHTYFLWQIGVSESARGQGLATKMIRQLLSSPGMAQINTIETTITPGNEASRRLFTRLAEKLNAPLEIRSEFFAESCFPQAGAHEAEDLFLIGPFDTPQT